MPLNCIIAMQCLCNLSPACTSTMKGLRSLKDNAKVVGTEEQLTREIKIVGEGEEGTKVSGLDTIPARTPSLSSALRPTSIAPYPSTFTLDLQWRLTIPFQHSFAKQSIANIDKQLGTLFLDHPKSHINNSGEPAVLTDASLLHSPNSDDDRQPLLMRGQAEERDGYSYCRQSLSSESNRMSYYLHDLQTPRSLDFYSTHPPLDSILAWEPSNSDFSPLSGSALTLPISSACNSSSAQQFNIDLHDQSLVLPLHLQQPQFLPQTQQSPSPSGSLQHSPSLKTDLHNVLANQHPHLHSDANVTDQSDIEGLASSNLSPLAQSCNLHQYPGSLHLCPPTPFPKNFHGHGLEQLCIFNEACKQCWLLNLKGKVPRAVKRLQ